MFEHLCSPFIPVCPSVGTRLGALEPCRDVLWGPSGAADNPLSQTPVAMCRQRGRGDEEPREEEEGEGRYFLFRKKNALLLPEIQN